MLSLKFKKIKEEKTLLVYVIINVDKKLMQPQ